MKKWAGNILLLLGATIISVVALELALRVVYPAHESWRLYSVPDPELGWSLQPGAKFTRQVPGAFVEVSYNAQGFRDDDGNRPVPANATRVVVLGDSYMEANMVPLQDVLHKQLERLARKDGAALHSWNLGVAGYGTLQEYLTYRKAGSKHKPDIVLLAFYLHNDLRNNSEHLNLSAQALRAGKRKRPFLEEGNTQDWLINKPDFEAINRKFQKRKNSLSFRIRHNSVLLTMLRNARRSLRSRADTFHGGGTLSMHRCDSDKTYAKAWETTERILIRLKQTVEADGASLIVFSVPALFDADPGFVRELQANSGGDLNLCTENSPGYAMLRKVLERNAIGYVDTVPAFQKAVGAKSADLFVKGDWHWNGAGHALAAGEVYKALRDKGVIGK